MNILYRVGILIVLLLFSVVSTSAASACSAQPANADGTTITSPTPDQVVTSPFTIQGMYFGSFEGVVPIQLLDENGTEILRVNAMNECCVLAAYQRQVTFSVSALTPACIVVSRESGADGSLTPLAQIPVTLSPSPGMPGTANAPMLSLPLLLMVALILVSGGLLLRRRTRLG